jgi:hypothetical protein
MLDDRQHGLRVEVSRDDERRVGRVVPLLKNAFTSSTVAASRSSWDPITG